MSSRGGSHTGDPVHEIILNHAKFTLKKAGEELQKEELKEIKHEALKKVDQFSRYLNLKERLLDPAFVRERYKNCSPSRKIQEKKEDFLMYDKPVTLGEKKDILGLLKGKPEDQTDYQGVFEDPAG